jgi:hypothetical protein
MLSNNDNDEALRWTDSPNEDSCFNNESDNKCKICFEEFRNDQTLGNHWMENHEKEAQWLFRNHMFREMM